MKKCHPFANRLQFPLGVILLPAILSTACVGLVGSERQPADWKLPKQVKSTCSDVVGEYLAVPTEMVPHREASDFALWDLLGAKLKQGAEQPTSVRIEVRDGQKIEVEARSKSGEQLLTEGSSLVAHCNEGVLEAKQTDSDIQEHSTTVASGGFSFFIAEDQDLVLHSTAKGLYMVTIVPAYLNASFWFKYRKLAALD